MKVINQKGFTIIESVVSILILGVIIVVAMRLTDYSTTNIRILEDAAKEPRIMTSILARSLNYMDRFPVKVQIAQNGLLDPAHFDNPQVAENLCFSDTGVEVSEGTETCRFKIALYKVELRDSAFPANGELGHLPVDRIYFRVTDLMEKKKTKNYKYFSKLVTRTMVN